MADMRELNDPQWEVHEGLHHAISQHQEPTRPQVGVGGYVCNCCAQPTIVLAAFHEHFQISVGVVPAAARAIAADILAAVERVEGKKGLN